MKYLRRFNESIEEEGFDLEEIKDIFQDIIDEGFKLDDVKIGSALSLYPNKWVSNHRNLSNKLFRSLTIRFKTNGILTINFETLDILDGCIKHFESYYGIKLEWIFTNGLPTSEYFGSGSVRTAPFNWFNSCETIKNISKYHSERVNSDINKIPLILFDLGFKLD